MSQSDRPRRPGGQQRGQGGGEQRPAVAPKPFVWLSLPQQAPRKVSSVGLEVFRGLTGRLDVSFVVESAYMHVGSGNYEFQAKARPNEPDVYHTFCRRGEKLCVPGTSLKGAIRSIVEAISNSCVSQAGTKEFVQPTHSRCGENAEQVCISCSLFGRTGWRGRIHFNDALPAEEPKIEIVKINELWAPRVTQGRKFYSGNQFQALPNKQPEKNHRFVEGVVRGSRFSTAIVFENVQSEELGLVCCALGWDVDGQGKLVSAFMPKIGGAKPRCFGMVRFTAPTVTLWTSESKLQLTRKAITGQDALAFISQCIVQCKKSQYFVATAWQALVGGLKAGVPCPKGLY